MNLWKFIFGTSPDAIHSPVDSRPSTEAKLTTETALESTTIRRYLVPEATVEECRELRKHEFVQRMMAGKIVHSTPYRIVLINGKWRVYCAPQDRGYKGVQHAWPPLCKFVNNLILKQRRKVRLEIKYSIPGQVLTSAEVSEIQGVIATDWLSLDGQSPIRFELPLPRFIYNTWK